MARAISFTQEGVLQSHDVDELLSVPHGSEDEHRQSVCADMAWWGSLRAAAEKEAALAEARYRAWQSAFRQDLLEQYRISDNKVPAEHVLKTAAETDPAFLQHKAEIAEAQRVVTLLAAMYDAFWRKAAILTKDDRARYVEAGFSHEIVADGSAAKLGREVTQKEREEVMKKSMAESAPVRRQVLNAKPDKAGKKERK